MKRFASAFVVIAVAVVLYRKAIRLWWTFDDPANLHFALTHPWTDAFRTAQPFLHASHSVLLRVSGLDPDPWYRVQIALVALSAIAIYLTLRLFLEELPALGGALVFVAGPPLCVAATQLRTMPALESIVLAAAAVASYAVAFRRRSFALELLSSALYLLAMLASVLAVPLPLVLLLVPDAGLRVRLRHLLVHAIALIAFVVWQRPVPDLDALAVHMLTGITGDGLFFGVIALIVLSIGIAIAVRTPQRNAVLTALGATLLSVVLAGGSGVFAMWVWISVVFAFGAATLSLSPRVVLVASAIAVVIVANRQEWAAEYATTSRMSDEARVFLTLDGASLLRKPSIPPVTMAELRWLKESHFGRAIGTGWFYDDLYLCEHFLRGRHFYEYSAATKKVVEVTARIPDFAGAWCGKIRDDAPLRAEFHHRNGTLAWRLGPYATGQYTILVDEGVRAFVVAKEDSRPFRDMAGTSLRIRYDSPEGWVTYSPSIELNFARQPDFTWHR